MEIITVGLVLYSNRERQSEFHLLGEEFNYALLGQHMGINSTPQTCDENHSKQ